MKVDLYTICYNEEKFLPHFLKHYEPYVRKMVVYDNFSTDTSPEIIASHPLAVYRRYDTGGVCNNHAMIQIKNHAWKQSRDADWVIVCDIDELLYHPSGLDHVFRRAKGIYTVVQPAGYSMFLPEFPTTDQPIWSKYKLGVYDRMFCKCVLFDPKQITEIRYASGAHKCRPLGNVLVGQYPRLVLLHYRFLGLEDTKKRFKLLWARTEGKFGKYAQGAAEAAYRRQQKMAKQVVQSPSPVVLDLLPMPHIITVRSSSLPQPQKLNVTKSINSVKMQMELVKDESLRQEIL